MACIASILAQFIYIDLCFKQQKLQQEYQLGYGIQYIQYSKFMKYKQFTCQVILNPPLTYDACVHNLVSEQSTIVFRLEKENRYKLLKIFVHRDKLPLHVKMSCLLKIRVVLSLIMKQEHQILIKVAVKTYATVPLTTMVLLSS